MRNDTNNSIASDIALHNVKDLFGEAFLRERLKGINDAIGYVFQPPTQNVNKIHYFEQSVFRIVLGLL